MKIETNKVAAGEHGSVVGYLLFAVVVAASIAGVAGYLAQNLYLSSRRSDMINALQFSEGGAAIACFEIEKAFTNRSGTFLSNLMTNSAGAWTSNSSLSTGGMIVFDRTITAPFSNQAVYVQMRMTNASSPSMLTVISRAGVRGYTNTTTVDMAVQFGYGGAIISDAKGTTANGISKAVAQAGNVVIDGGAKGTTVIEGGILANGNVNVGLATVDDIQKQLYGTDKEIPDYTAEGSPDQLFDFTRFVLAAKASSNYFSNLTAFVNAAKSNTLEGIIAVDIPTKSGLPSLDEKTLPNGINIRGTLVFNFGPVWEGSDKIVNTATMNINPANLSGFNGTNPATWGSGYPPTYVNSNKHPANINLLAYTTNRYANFTHEDDLPALMYSIGILDIHGDANICGVLYTPSFVEIENKQDAQVQYIRGSIIGGAGVLVENGKASKSVVYYDPKALDKLATSGTKGKSVKVLSWR
jgi:hypothetical protein